MTPKTRRRIGTAAASGAVLLVLGTATASNAAAGEPAEAASPAPGTASRVETPSTEPHSLYAPSVVTLTFTTGESAEPVQRAVSLSCDPTGGTHPDPVGACQVLAAAHGDVTAIPPSGTLCTFEYAPVTVTARGVWAGSLRSYTGTFANRCVLIQRTAGLFAF